MSSIDEPIRRELVVPADPERAFAIFTAEISRWWPMATHSVGGVETVSVTIDGRVGGDIAEATRDGGRSVWGTVRLWEPPHRFVTTWHPGRPADDATELEVRFEPAPTGSRLVLEHRGWERVAWSGDRASYERGWEPVISAFGRLVSAEASPAAAG